MTRTLSIILVLALPLMAEEKKKSTAATSTAEATSNEATTTTAATAEQQAQPDSPLVAAAKRANRLGRKPATKVITNDTLKTSGGNAHVTTTERQAVIQMPKPMAPPRETPEMAAARAQQAHRAKAAEQAAIERKAKEEQQRKAEAEAAARDEGYDGMQDDAAEVTGTAPPPQF